MTTPANPADLLTWLRAQLDEDAQLIDEYEAFQRGLPGGTIVVPPGWLLGEPFDTGRQRAEVDAKRRILDEAERVEAKAREALNGEDSGLALVLQGERLAMERTVRMMARIFADRPGYREAGGEP